MRKKSFDSTKHEKIKKKCKRKTHTEKIYEKKRSFNFTKKKRKKVKENAPKKCREKRRLYELKDEDKKKV